MFGRKKAAEDDGGPARGLLKGKLLVDRLRRESRPPAPGDASSRSHSREGSPAPTRPKAPAPTSSLGSAHEAKASSHEAKASSHEAQADERRPLRPSRPSRKSVDLHAGSCPSEGSHAMSASQLADWHKQRAAEHAHLAAVAAAAAARFGPEAEGESEAEDRASARRSSISDDPGHGREAEAPRASGRRRSVDAASSRGRQGDRAPEAQHGPQQPEAQHRSHAGRRKSMSGDLAPPGEASSGGARRRGSLDGSSQHSTAGQPREEQGRSAREREAEGGGSRARDGGATAREERPQPWAFDAEQGWDSPIAHSEPALAPVAPIRAEQRLDAPPSDDHAPKSDRPRSMSERHDPAGAVARAMREPRCSPLNPNPMLGKPGPPLPGSSMGRPPGAQTQKPGRSRDEQEARSSRLRAEGDLECVWPHTSGHPEAGRSPPSPATSEEGEEGSSPEAPREARGRSTGASQGARGHSGRALPGSGRQAPEQGHDRRRSSLDAATRHWGEVDGQAGSGELGGSGQHAEAGDLAYKLWGAQGQEQEPGQGQGRRHGQGQGHGQGHKQEARDTRGPQVRSSAPRNKNLLLTLQQTQMEQKRRQSFSSAGPGPHPGVAIGIGGDLLPQATSMGHSRAGGGPPLQGQQGHSRRSLDVSRAAGGAHPLPQPVLRPRSVWECAEEEAGQESGSPGPGRPSSGASGGRPPRNPCLVGHSLPDLPERERTPTLEGGFGPDPGPGTFSIARHLRPAEASGSPRLHAAQGVAQARPRSQFPDVEHPLGSTGSGIPRSPMGMGTRGSTRDRSALGPQQLRAELQSHVSNPWPKAGPHSPRQHQQLVMLSDGTWAAGSESGGAYSCSGGSGHMTFGNHMASRTSNTSLASSRDSRHSTLERNYSIRHCSPSLGDDDHAAQRSLPADDLGPGAGAGYALPPRSGSGQRHPVAARNAKSGSLSPLGQGLAQGAGAGDAEPHDPDVGHAASRAEGGGRQRRPQLSQLSTDDISLMYAGEGLDTREAPPPTVPQRRARRRSLEGASGGDEQEHEHEEVQRVFQGAQECKGHAGARGLAAWGLGKVKGLADPKKLATTSVLNLAPADILDAYRMGKVLGEGQFGTTRLVVCRESGREYACKTISKATLKCKSDLEDVRREHAIFEMLKGLKHVPRIQDTFETDQEIHFVMELCTGGDLFDRLKARTRYTEAKAASVLRVVLEVLAYCHERLLVHRDIKPENILLCSKASDTDVKVIDFGISAQLKPGGKPLTELMGSPFYIAPEVIAGSYGCPADLWSTGVMLYVLLFGVPPFWAKTQAGILRAIREAKLKFQKSVPLSEAAKDFIRKLLDRDPTRRLTAAEALRHPWLSTAGAAQNWHTGNEVAF